MSARKPGPKALKQRPLVSVESTQSSDSLGAPQAPRADSALRGPTLGLMNSASKSALARQKNQSAADSTSAVSPQNDEDQELKSDKSSLRRAAAEGQQPKFGGMRAQRVPSAAATNKFVSKKAAGEDANGAQKRKPPVTPKPVDPVGASLATRMKRGNIQAVCADPRAAAAKKPVVFRLRQAGQQGKLPASKK